MTSRANPYTSLDLVKPLIDYAKLIEGRLEPGLGHLVKIRASQINGCAMCLNMHTQEALADGETPQRLFLLDAWRESPLYSAHERAALAWTEAVTLVSQTHVPDTVYEEVRIEFEPEELVKLTLLIATINAWNRFAISFRSIHPVKAQTAAA